MHAPIRGSAKTRKTTHSASGGYCLSFLSRRSSRNGRAGIHNSCKRCFSTIWVEGSPAMLHGAILNLLWSPEEKLGPRSGCDVGPETHPKKAFSNPGNFTVPHWPACIQRGIGSKKYRNGGQIPSDNLTCGSAHRNWVSDRAAEFLHTRLIACLVFCYSVRREAIITCLQRQFSFLFCTKYKGRDRSHFPHQPCPSDKIVTLRRWQLP